MPPAAGRAPRQSGSNYVAGHYTDRMDRFELTPWEPAFRAPQGHSGTSTNTSSAMAPNSNIT